jgi:uncharacterized protein
LDPQTEQAIYNAGVQLFQKTGAQIVAVTVDTIDGKDIQEYGLQLGRRWGVGDEEKDTGIVLLLAMQEREVGINVGYGLEGAVTDAQSGLFLDTYAIPLFKENDFSGGMLAVYNALVNETYLEFGIKADPNYVPIDVIEEQNSRGSLILFIGFVVFIVLFCLISPRLKRRFPGIVFLPSGLFHHHGGHGGGGFGGFRGGGGSFGGGGSSRGF